MSVKKTGKKRSQRAKKRDLRKRRPSVLEQLEDRRMLASDWQNPSDRYDVNNDGVVVPNDALIVLNYLAANRAGELPLRSANESRYVDVNGDSSIAPIDVLQIINYLSRPTRPTLPVDTTGFLSMPLMSLPGTPNQQVEVLATYQRESAELRAAGLFVMDNAEGAVDGILPTDPRYASRVLQSVQRTEIFSQSIAPSESSAGKTFAGGSHLGLYLLSRHDITGPPEKYLRATTLDDGALQIGWEEHDTAAANVPVLGDRGFDDAYLWFHVGQPLTNVNRPPVLTPIGDKSVDELQTLTVPTSATDPDLPDDTLTFSLDPSDTPAGATINAQTGTFTWTPTEAQGPGAFTATVIVTDRAGLSDRQQFTIAVGEINRPPILAPIGDKSIDELQTLTVPTSATDPDLPDDTLTFSLDPSDTPAGATINAQTGVFSWTPTEAQGPGTFTATVIVTDRAGLSDRQQFTIAVGEVNRPPVLAPIGDRSIDELQTLTVPTSATDPDLPDDTLTFSLDPADTPAGATINAQTGVFSWTPTESQGPGAFTATVIVTDRAGLSDRQQFTIAVGEVNRPPILAPIGDKSIDELQTLTVPTSATDPDLPDDTLTFSLDPADTPAGATINAQTGTFSWTPTEAQGPGTFTATVIVTDRAGLSDRQQFTIAVGEVNRPPILAPIGDKSIDELQTLTVPTSATDPDLPDDTLTFSLDPSDTPAGATINAQTGTFTWTPTEAQGPGTFTATVIVTDRAGLSDRQQFTIAVGEVNRPPVLAPIGDRSIDELQTLTVPTSATDPDLPDDTLTFSLDPSDTPAGATINAQTGLFSWTPTEAQGPGTFTATVIVTDRAGLSDRQQFTIAVGEVNRPPVLAPIGDRSIDELQTLTVPTSATDPDLPDDTLTFSLDPADTPAGATIDAQTGVFNWTPTEAQGPGSFTATVIVTDRAGLSDRQQFTIAVGEVNRPPVLAPIGDRSIDELQTLTVPTSATDPDLPDDTLTFSLDPSDTPAGAAINAQTGTFSWTPTEAQGPGTFTATVIVTDRAGLSDRQQFTIAVGEISRPPILSPIGDRSIDELQTLTVPTSATDPDLPDDTLTFSLDPSDTPAGATINAQTGVFNWTPTESQGPGSFTATVIVTDRAGLSDRQQFTIVVGEVNRPPVLAPIGDRLIDELQTLTVPTSATDPDLPDDTLTFSLDPADTPAGATINAQTGVFSWTPTEAQGPSSFTTTVIVTDSGGLSDRQQFTIVVGEVNRPPILAPIGDKSIDELQTLTVPTSATDPDLPDDTLTFSLDPADTPAGATINAQTGVFSWTPTEAQGPGTFTATVIVTDRAGLSDRQQFTIVVGEVNRPPILAPIGDKSIDELQTLTVPTSATDPDLPDDTLTFSLDPSDTPAGATINAQTGVFSWTPTVAQGAGTFTTTVIVTDRAGLSDRQQFTISRTCGSGFDSWHDAEFGGSIDGAGSVRRDGCGVQLIEGDSFLVSYETQVEIPAGAQTLQLWLDDVSFDLTDAHGINDAIEIGLIDAEGYSLASTFDVPRDAYFNWTESLAPANGGGTRYDPMTGQVTVDVDHLLAGTRGTLIVRLVNNDADHTTSVRLVGGLTFELDTSVATVARATSEPTASAELFGAAENAGVQQRVIYGPVAFAESVEATEVMTTNSENSESLTPSDPTKKEWISASGGDWNDPANWEGGTLPTADDDILIDIPGGDFSVTIASGTVLVNSLTSSDPLSIRGGRLEMAADSTITDISLSAGSVSADAKVSLSASFTWSGGKLEGDGTFSLAQNTTGHISGSGSKSLVATLENHGTLTLEGTGSLNVGLEEYDYDSGQTISLPGTLINRSGAVLDIQSTGGIRGPEYYDYGSSSDSILINEGTLRKSVSSGTSRIGIDLMHSGELIVETGTLELSSGGVSSGSTRIAEDATLAVSAYNEYESGTSAPFNFESGSTTSGNGSLRLSGGEVNFAGSLSTTSVLVNGATAGFQNNANVIPQLTLVSGVIAGADSSTLRVTETFDWQSGTVQGDFTLLVASTATGNLSGSGSKSLVATLENHGTLTLEGTGSLNVGLEEYDYDSSQTISLPGTLINRSGAVLDIQSTGGIRGPEYFEYGSSSDSILINEGTLRKSVSSGTSQIGIDWMHSGELLVETGTLRLSHGLTHAATVRIAADARLEIGTGYESESNDYIQNGGITEIRGGTLQAPGQIQINAGDFQATGHLIGDIFNNAKLYIGFDYEELSIRGNYTQTDAASLRLGASDQSGFQVARLLVNGAVNLAGNLNLDLNDLSSLDRRIGFIENDGTDAIVGSFANIAEGDMLAIGGVNQPFSYQGGNGNDVALGPRPTLWLSDSTIDVLESGVAEFTIHISEPYTDVVNVGYRLISGTTDDNDLASNPGDYSVQIQPGETQATFEVVTHRDDDTTSETFSIRLIDPIFGDLASPSQTDVTIIDTSDREISVGDLVLLEGGVASFVVSLSQPRDVPVTVQYATDADGATLGTFTAASGTLTFAPGETTKTVDVQTHKDILTNDDSFQLLLSNPTENYIRQGVGRAMVLLRGETPDDPGDSITDAHPLSLTTGQLTRVDQEIVGDGIYRNWDVDLYQVDLVAGQTLYVVAIGTSIDDLATRLFDVSGNEIFGAAIGDRINLAVATSGTYYIGISGPANRDYDPNRENSGSDGTATGGYSLRLSVDGTSELPDIAVFADAAAKAPIDNDTDPLDIGTVSLGETYRAAVYVRNDGVGPLNILDVVTPSGVRAVGNFQGDVAAGTSRTLILEFTGQNVGGFDATIQILTNDPDQPTYAFDVSADVLPPPLDALQDVITGILPGVGTSLDVLANDLGANLAIVSATLQSGAGQVAVSNDLHSLIFTPETSFTTATLVYQITDGISTDTATVIVQANQAPNVSDDVIADVQAGQTIDLYPLDNDTDPDGDSLTIVAVDSAPGVSFSSNKITFTAPDDFAGTEVSYTVADAAGNRSTATIRITPPADSDWTFAVDFDRLVDVTDSVRFDYQTTSFDARIDTLYADLSLENIGTYPVRGPILLGVNNIDDPLVRVIDPDGVTPGGMPYFNITDLVISPDSPFFAVGDRFETTLAFDVPARHRFNYELVVLGFLNESPQFTSTPIVQALPGTIYRYDSHAADPDFDRVSYEKVAGPAGLSVVQTSGIVNWQTTAADVGSHQVTLRATDPFGASALHTFIIGIGDSANRPPRFTSTPVETAVATQRYTYQLSAIDPDTDPVTFTLLDGPEGLTIADAQRGLITWTPTADRIGQTVPVSVLAEDGRGGSATHRFHIAIVDDVANRPPIIVTQPQTTWYLPDATASAPSGDVGPDSINLALEDGQRSKQSVSLTFPAAEIPGADIIFIVDESGSMSGGHQWLKSMISNLEQGLLDKGVVSNRYALVGYGASDPKPREVQDWTDSAGLESAVDRLRIDGGFEDGYQAIAFALSELETRDSASKQIILITDEPRDIGSDDTFGSIVQLLDDNDATLHSVVEANYEDIFQKSVFGGAADGKAFSEAPNGQYASSIALDVIGEDRTELEYINLVFAVGGTTWDIGQLEQGGNTVLSFTGAFVDQISEDVIEDLAIDLVSSNPDINFLNLTGIQPGADGTTVTFDVEFIGDGTAVLFDLQFVRASDPTVVFGSIPVSVQVPYRYDVDAIDPDQDPLAYRLVGESHGASFDPDTGLLVWTPTQPGDYTFTAVADDGRGGTDLQTWTVAVLSSDQVNTPPEMGPIDPINIQAENQVRFTVSASDDDGDVLRYQLVNDPSSGSAIPAGMVIDRFTGAISWTPSTDQAGTHQIDILVADPRGGSDTATLTVNVSLPQGFVNARPAFTSTPDPNAFVGGTYRYDAVAEDPDREVLTYTLIHASDGMTIDPATGRIGWNPSSDQTGTQKVYIRATDPRGAHDLQVVDINVSDLNAAPQITSIPSPPTAPGSVWQYAVLAVDPNGDPLVFELDPASLDRGMQIDAATGVVTWTPTAAGNFDVTVRVSDPTGRFDLQSFTLSIEVNAPPQITSQPDGTLYAGEAFTYDLTTADDDGDTVTLSLDPASIDRGVRLNGNQLSWIPSRIGTFETTIIADDGRGGTSTQTLTLPVYARATDSQPPQITSTPAGPIYAESPWQYAIKATDPDGDDSALVYELIDADTDHNPLASGETIDFDPATGTLTWTTPNPTSRSFTLGVTDAAGVQTTQSFTATAASPRTGQPPRITSVPHGPAVLGQEYQYQVLAFDPDGDSLRYELDSPVAGASIDAVTGSLTLVPDTSNPLDLTIRVYDVDADGHPRDGAATQSFTLAVALADAAAPEITSRPTGPARLGQTWTYTLVATDSSGDDDAVEHQLISPNPAALPAGMHWDPATATLTWTPASTDPIDFVFLAIDDFGIASEQSFTLQVAAPSANRAPVFRSLPVVSIPSDAAYRYTALAVDPDGDRVTYALQQAPAGMTIDATTGQLSWQAAGIGDYTVVVSADDGVATPVTQRFQVVVTAPRSVNAPPSITSTPQGPAIRGNQWTYNAQASDPNGDQVSWRIGNLADFPAANQPAIDAATGEISWTPVSEGSYDFLVHASDRSFAAGTAFDGQRFTLSVQGNLPPRFISSPLLELSAGDDYSYQAIAIDPNTSDTLTYSLDDESIALGMQLSADGLLSWTDTDAVGRYPVTLRVSDGEGLFDSQRFAFVIQSADSGSGDNTAPQITSRPSGQIIAGTPFNFQFTAVDPDGDTVSFQAADGKGLPAGATLSADGLFNWPPAVDQIGSQSFSIRATDGALAGPTVTVTLEVLTASENAAPVFVTTPVTRVVQGKNYQYDARATDAGGDTVHYFLDAGSLARGMTLDAAGNLRWDTAGVTSGRYAVTLTAADADTIAGGLTDTQSFIVEVASSVVNSPPSFTSTAVTTALAGGLYSYTARATDADGDTLSYGKITGPDGLVVDPASGRVQWIPSTVDLGQHTVTLAVADGRGGLDRQSFTINVAGANRPPVITSTAPAQAYLGETYVYQVAASDPDGHTLRYSLAEPFTNADDNGSLNIDPVTGLLSWTPASLGTGSYQVQINVVDSYGLGTGQAFAIRLLSERPNNAPRWSPETNPPLSVPRSSDTDTITYRYDFDATDPDGDPVTYTLADGPAGASIDADGVLTWDVPADQPVGLPVSFQIIATDVPPSTSTPRNTNFNYSVQIQFQNFAPVVEPIADAQIVAGGALRIDVRARDANAGDTLTYRLNDAATSAGMAIDAYGRITWSTDVADITTTPIPVTVTVSDGFSDVAENFTVAVTADQSGPAARIVASDSAPDVGDELALQLFATDDVGVATRFLRLDSVTRAGTVTPLNRVLQLDAAGRARLTIDASLIGVLTFSGYATDAAGNRGDAADLQLTVVNPNDGAPPEVRLDLARGTALTGVTDVYGRVTDDVPDDLRWSLSIRNNETGVEKSLVKNAFGAVDAGLLGQIDATLLANGNYTLSLSATDAGGNTATDTEIVSVEGRLKLGNFSLSFDDLEVPVAGIPITIRRTYDTLDANELGDFGYGWNLEIAQPELTVDRSTTGPNSFGYGRSYPTFVEGTRVTVTTPEGIEESFTMRWVGSSQGSFFGITPYYRPSFVGDSGNQYELIAPGADQTFSRLTQNGPYTLAGDTLDYSGLNPLFGDFQLKEIDRGSRGLSYTIDNETLTGIAVEDKYGNKLTYDTDQEGRIYAINSNRGRSVTIDRDWQGRITAITDPNGYQLKYSYDGQGRLSEFYDRRATQRLQDADPNNDFGATTFAYDPGFGEDYENFLVKITDPLGVDALRASFDPETGRLESLQDAEGNPATVGYDLDSLTVTSESSSGKTQVTLDDHGNPIRSVDEAGQVMLTAYHDPDRGLPARVTQVIGTLDTEAQRAAGTGDDLVTHYSYNQYGQRTSETDPRGNTSHTTYDRNGYPSQEIDIYGNVTHYSFYEGQLSGTTDADGNVTAFSYDAFGNVQTVTQSNPRIGTQTTTTFEYNDFGDLIRTIDPDGNVRSIDYDATGNQTGTTFVWNDPLGILPPQTITTSSVIGPDGGVDSSTDATGQTSVTMYDALGRAYLQVDQNGRQSQTIYDTRGLAIETRSEAPDENGVGTWLVSRTLYDESGRAVYSTGSFPESVFTDSPDQITGTHTLYDDAGRVVQTEQVIGLNIQLVGQASSLSSQTAPQASSLSALLVSAGSVISFTASTYDDANRVVETTNDYGLRAQTLYGQYGEVVESRSETVASDGTRSWLVSRTIYDEVGRAAISSDRFLVPGDTPLGEDPASGPVLTQLTKTIYDGRGRSIATERYTDATISLSQDAELDYSPQPFVTDSGNLESVSQTLYDEAGRVWRTISGRVPVAALSPTALTENDALRDFPIYSGGTDRYASKNLSVGTINDTLFDDRGRQYASLGHPLPAESIGLSGSDYDGNLVRLRSETIYDSLGQASLQRSGLAHVTNTQGDFLGIFDNNSVDTKTYTDAFGNAYRMDYITGGIVGVEPLGDSNPATVGVEPLGDSSRITTRTSGTLHSYTLTRFDAENRPIAEMQQTAGSIAAVWSDAQNSFVIEGTSTLIPTKLYVYDADDRLAEVRLPAVTDPDTNAGDALTRPTYQYQYDARGNQTGIIDPLGRETRFTFTDRGQQATRTLPVGVEALADRERISPDSPFTESFAYDDRGRQLLHISFEGVVTENVYDNFGRMSEMRYYSDQAAFESGTVAQTRQFQYDGYGRNVGNRLLNASGNPTRIEATVYDARGRIVYEQSPEGILGYDYDNLGRMTHVAIYDSNFTLPQGGSDALAAGEGLPLSLATRITHYDYDILGRLTTVSEDATPADTSDATLDTNYGFDLQGRMASESTTNQPMGVSPGSGQPQAPSLTTTYDFDPLGRLDTITDTDASGNTTASYDYDVRADGKRTALEETFWIDANDDGQQTPDELQTTSYDWSYDDLGRLTDEVIDHWDDAFDVAESYQYDLTGNRTGLDRDAGNDSVLDEVIAYNFDANDRLLEEVLDDLVDNANDTTTTYGYDHTQQTSKQVSRIGFQPVSSQHFTYNLQGRMSSVTNENFDSDSTLASRTRTSYTYDSKSFRVALKNETGTTLSSDGASEVWSLTTEVSYLADRHNHTGYTQTIRETEFDAAGNVVKTIDYTFGHDEIAQTVTDASGNTETLVFGHDGHGSVRVLYDLAGSIDAIATYSAFGVLVATHNALGNIHSSTFTDLTSLGYSGEAWDSATGQQYLRARYYNPASAQFNRLDPFAGNMQDPQSLHKYAYVHGDPIGMVDPSGMISLIGGLSAFSIGSSLRNSNAGAAFTALRTAKSFSDFYRAIGAIVAAGNTGYDTFSAIWTAIDLISFDPSDLVELKEAVPAAKAYMQGALTPNAPNPQIFKRKIGFPIRARGKLGQLRRMISALPNAEEMMGEFGAALVAKQLGFEDSELEMNKTGIDGVMYNPSIGKYIVIEAKGGKQGLSRKTVPWQFTHPWIEDRLNKLVQENRGYGGNFEAEADLLDDEIDNNRQLITMVVSLNLSLKGKQLKFGMQLYDPDTPSKFHKWKGFGG